jgi:hypothetical protein
VRSAEEYRREQIAAHGDSVMAMWYIALNQAINRYVFGIEDRHESLESPGEKTANDLADFAARVAELSAAAAGGGYRHQPPVRSIYRNADKAVELARRAATRGRIGKSPQAFGTRAHLYFKRFNERLNRRLAKKGNRFRVSAEEFRTERGTITEIHARDSIGADAVVTDSLNKNYKRVFDLKTYQAIKRPIAESRQREFKRRFGSQAREIYRQR